MYGDTVPGDITHTDVASKFSEFFKNYIRKLPKDNSNVRADNVKKLITPLFQVSTYRCTSLYVTQCILILLNTLVVLYTFM